ncbi:MAG: ATP-binding protein, partial [Thalassolituus oleivorans]|nr:ATP-binding protein [Thalassolituus oleivorans]
MVWLVNKLRLFASWLERKSISNDSPSKFKDLAPIDDADEDGVYSEAIRFALSREKVSNIALTGPYGSGKSSIIQSFLKSYGKPVLQISLASFVSGAEAGKGGGVTRQEIERSILQQMLYGADSNKLPFSRFKRIQSPGAGSIFKSFFILIGILSVWYVL